MQDTAEKVDKEFACPGCGERDIDKLVWDDSGEFVQCQSCQHTYVPVQLYSSRREAANA